MGKLDNVVTADNKKRAWAKVAQSVSAVGETERDAIAIKKEWAGVKSLVKKKAAERARETRKTGGGTSSVKLALEEKILGMIGESLVGGVQGGVETGDNSCMQLLQQTQTDAMVDLDFLPTQAGVATIQVILPTQDIVPPHIELEVQQNNSEEDLSLPQLISESILQPTPVMTHSMRT
ncbi:unnamed protein product [Arctogadus glacialis]